MTKKDQPTPSQDFQTDPFLCSPAEQARASANVRRELGLVTPEEQARARLDTLKDGLRAKFIAEPDHPAGWGRMYRRAHAGLREEFQPKHFADAALLESLAFDLMQLVRAKMMTETLFSQSPMDSHMEYDWDSLKKARRNRRSLRKALADFEADAPWTMPVAEAQALAIWVVDILNWFAKEQGLDKSFPQTLALPKHDEDSAREVKILAGAGEYFDKCREDGFLVAVLTGQRSLTAAQRPGAAAIFTFAEQRAALFADRFQRVEEKARQETDAVLKLVAEDPTKLVLLQKYETALERNIERKFGLLCRRLPVARPVAETNLPPGLLPGRDPHGPAIS